MIRIIQHCNIGIGELLLMEPCFRYWRFRGDDVFLETSNLSVEPFANLLSIKVIRWGEGAAVRMATLMNACPGIPEIEKYPHINGNRTRAWAEFFGIKDCFDLIPKVPRPMPSFSEWSSVSGAVFIQTYGKEPYKTPPKEWYAECVHRLRANGHRCVTIIEKGCDPVVPGIETFEADLTTFISMLRFIRAVIAFDSAPAWIAGALGKRGVVILGPSDSAGRVEFFPSISRVVADCPHAPCWKTTRGICCRYGVEDKGCWCLHNASLDSACAQIGAIHA